MTYHTSQTTRPVLLSIAVCAGMLLGACSWIPKGDAQFDVGIKDRGVASWYGEQFHGRLAANGEIFDMEALTAAHRTIPLGSTVRVVNLANGKNIHVRITDRGPYMNGRILDLSHAAAVLLEMDRGGLAHIQVEIDGQHHPELLWLSQAVSEQAYSLLIGPNAVSDRPAPIMTPSVRALPSDLWITRRIRRVPALLAADHTAHTEVAALVLS